MAQEKYEYESKTDLKDDSRVHFNIPASIILNNDAGKKRIAVFSFFSVYKGLNNKLFLSVNCLAEWTGKIPDRHKNGVNGKLIESIEWLKKNEYINYSEIAKHDSCMEVSFNSQKIIEECNCDRFALIYLDELKKIFNYQNPNSKDTSLSSDNILIVFAYLRMMIYRRKNKVLPEKANCSIEDIKAESTDVYNSYYKEIANNLNLSTNTISKIVDVLNELGLIYSEPLSRTKCDEKGEKWLTNHTLFCNFYKRENTYLYNSGENYYTTEIENKKKILNKIMKNN